MSCPSGINVMEDTSVADLQVTLLDLRLVSEPSCTTACTCTLRLSQVPSMPVIVDVKIKNNSPSVIMTARISVNLLKNGSVASAVPMAAGALTETTRCLNYGGDEAFITSDPFYLPAQLGTYTVAVNTLEALAC